jgi:hypothetical protein
MHEITKYAGVAGLVLGLYLLLTVSMHLSIPTTAGQPVLSK